MYFILFATFKPSYLSKLFLAGPVATGLATRFPCRLVVMVGALIYSSGILLTALAGSLVNVYLGLGFISGRLYSYGNTSIR